MSFKVFLFPAIAIIVYSILYRFIAKNIPADKEGKVLLRLPVLYKIIGWIGLAISVAIITSQFVYPDEHFTVLFIFFQVFGCLSVFSILLARNHYVRFDGATLEVRDFLGRVKTVEWAKLKDVGFILFLGLIRLKDDKGQTVYVHHHLKGIDQFLQTFEARTKWTKAVLPMRKQKFF